MGYDRLNAYHAAVELRREVDSILTDIKGVPVKGVGNTVRHLNEAVDSVANNIAEGNDSQYPKRRASFFENAPGSVREARNCLQSLAMRKAVSPRRVYGAIGLTYVIGKMLYRLPIK